LLWTSSVVHLDSLDHYLASSIAALLYPYQGNPFTWSEAGSCSTPSWPCTHIASTLMSR
jgi:hypothetical protein